MFLFDIYNNILYYTKEFIVTSTSPNLFIHGLMAVFIIYLLTKRPFKPRQNDTLTKAEEDELIREWSPIPLTPKTNPLEVLNQTELIIQESEGTHVTINNKKYLNLARSNYLGLINNPEINKISENAIRKYGVGSCGPRGFYGTIDVHLDLEKKTASFMKTPEAVLYSSAYATISSAIPSFSKIGDIIIVDRGVSQPVQVGVSLSRSRIYYFNHNDMDDLQRVLEQTQFKGSKAKIVRKFVVIEGLYYNSGTIAPLPQILKFKEQYKFRLIMDESHSVGVLGSTGRGLTEHYNIDTNLVDILTGSYGNSFSSGGGFCCGSPEVVYHQRLNGVGYVFSASLPPFLACSSTKAIEMLEENPKMLEMLHSNIGELYQGLNKSGALNGLLEITSLPISPVIHLSLLDSKSNKSNRINDELLLQKIVDKAMDHGLLLTRAKYVSAEKFIPKPSIRISVSSNLSSDQIKESIEIIKKCTSFVLESN
ncbi:hypothetical protein ACTFIW_003584 [Dictyostelium discoideum]